MEEIIFVSENLQEEDVKFVQDGEQIKCAKSHEIMPVGTQYFTTAKGHNVNAKFFDEFYAYCEDCGDIRRKEDMLYDSCGYYCKSCRVKCEDCGAIVPRDDSYEIGDYYICSDCYYDNYFTCENCGRVEHIDYGYWSDRDDCYYCEDCFNDGYGRSGTIQGYHEHSNDLEFFFLNNEKKLVSSFVEDKEKLFLGAEIEVDSGSRVDSDDIAEEVQNIFPSNFIYQEEDGSLSYGFENITQPCTLDGHKSLENDYKQAFETMVMGGLRSHNTRTCGLHIHFNRSYFKDNEELYIARLLLIVEKFWDNMVKFSRRNLNSLNRWAKKYDMKAEEVAKMYCNGRNSLNRYQAVNLTNHSTIEFRMFRGTLKWTTYIATLELVNNIVEFAKTKSVDEINVMKWEELLISDNIKGYWEQVKDRNVPSDSDKENGVNTTNGVDTNS